MKRNTQLMFKGHFLFIILLATPFLFSSRVQAQTEGVPQDQRDSVHWQANTILNHFVSVLMTNSGYYGSGNMLGLQMKRFNGDHALRFNLDFKPSTSSLWDNSNIGQIRDRSGDTLRLVAEDYRSQQFRLGMGLERGKTGKIGRIYVGADASLSYRYSRHWAFEYFYDINAGRVDQEPSEQDFSQNPTRHLSAVGAGVKPFIGLERPLTEHWGFNLEAKLDLQLQYTEGYEVMDNGRFRAMSPLVYFESYPLLEVRLYYNI